MAQSNIGQPDHGAAKGFDKDSTAGGPPNVYGPGYPPPGYGPGSGYGQQYYPPAGYSPYPFAPPPTNTMAILALVFAFVFSPLGIAFGIIARNQIARTGEGGSGLALAGLIISLVFTALMVLYIIIVVAIVGAAVSSIPSPR
jgi:hypothetical protein